MAAPEMFADGQYSNTYITASLGELWGTCGNEMGHCWLWYSEVIFVGWLQAQHRCGS